MMVESCGERQGFDKNELRPFRENAGAILLEPRDQFDKCIVGVVERDGLHVVYDEMRILTALLDEFGSEEDAKEWYAYNIIGSYPGENYPLFLTLAVDSDE